MDSNYNLTQKELEEVEAKVVDKMREADQEYIVKCGKENIPLDVHGCYTRAKTMHDYNSVKTFYEKVLARRRRKFNKKPNADNQRMLRQATFAVYIVRVDLDDMYAKTYSEPESLFCLSEDEMKEVECNVNMRFTNLEFHLSVDEFLRVQDCASLVEVYQKVHDYRRHRFYERPELFKDRVLLRQAMYAQYYLNKKLDEMRMNEYSE